MTTTTLLGRIIRRAAASRVFAAAGLALFVAGALASIPTRARAIQAHLPAGLEIEAPPAARAHATQWSGAVAGSAAGRPAPGPAEEAWGAARATGAELAAHPLLAASLDAATSPGDAGPFSVPPRFAAGDPDGLGPVDIIETGRMTYVRFRQIAAGRPILGTVAVFQWNARGDLALARARWYPGVAARARRHVPAGGIDREAARAAALSGWRGPDSRADREMLATWEEDEEAWYPARDRTQPDSLTLVPVWRIRFHTVEPEGRWEALVDARDGELLSRQSLLRHAALEGTATALIEPGMPGEIPVVVPTPRAIVHASTGQVLGLDTTSAEGRYALDLPAGERARLAIELKGPFAWVRDAARALHTPNDTASARPPARVDFHWDDSNSSFAARDAYHHVVRAHDYIRALDPGPALAPLDQPIQARVDDASGSCNAWWNGTRLNFYAEGSGCVSSARVADVVFHEYGHAVTDYCYAPFSPPGDMGEAFSDYFATTLTNQPVIGRGFYGPGTRIREVERDRVWPDDANPSIHLQGLILAGALWDLRREVGAAIADPLFHYPRYAAAQSFDEYLMDLLAWDDDNANLDDGTPHFAAIIAAFRRHGIGDYSVRIEHAAMPDVEEPGPWLETSARISSLLPLDPDSVRFHYSTGGAFQTLTPEPLGDPRHFRIAIPSPSAETTVRYYWTAADTSGHRASLPAEGPAAPFTFLVGTDAQPPAIAHEPPPAITADRTVLTVHAGVTDNSGRVARATVRAHRLAGGDPAEADLLPWAGGGQRRGEVSLPALTAGDTLLYQIEATDAARTPNQGQWPAAGEARIAVRDGRTLDLETLPDDLRGEGGWEWGEPAGDPPAWSGQRLFATALAGPYDDNLSASLLFGPLDLRAWDRARLDFAHWYRTEAGFDGGRVEWAFTREGPWTPLTPAGGYPAGSVRALDGPGFSGQGDHWQRCVIPLDRLTGLRAWLRFQFESDARVRDLGWYIDELELSRAQALLPPARLRAVECGADCLELTWSPPAGVDTTAGHFLGYRLERTRAGEPPAWEALHDAPLRATGWRDRGLETGTLYRYRLAARWDEGSSPFQEVEAAPYAPALGLDFDSIRYELAGTAAGDTSFLVHNETGGTLQFNTYLAAAGAGIETTRLLFRRHGVEAWERLWDAPSDSAGPADLIAMDARDRHDAEIGPVLEIRLRGARPWGDPRFDWGGLIWLDTDDNLSTGRRDVNIGAEYLVAFGALAREAGHDGPAVLLDDRLRPLIGLTGASLPAGADSLAVAVPWELLGNPSEVRLQITLHPALGAEPFARAPRESGLSWIAREPRHGRAGPDDPQPCELSFDVSEPGNGIFQATLYLESNDATRPLRAIPVELVARGIVPRDVADLSFASEDRGVRVSFRIPPGLSVLGVVIEQSLADPIRWGARHAEPLLPDSLGRIEFLDTSVEAGREYRYRFRTLFDPQGLVVFGPYAATWEPAVAPRLALAPARPNPFGVRAARTEFRCDLPQPGPARLQIFDAAGRRVRTLFDAVVTAGPRYVWWDGRDDAGRDLPSGSYWVSLRAPAGQRGTRVVLIR